jgi:hypothetical protein
MGQDLSKTRVVLCAIFLIRFLAPQDIYILPIYLSLLSCWREEKEGEKRVNEYIRECGVGWVHYPGRYRPCCPSGTAHD